MPVESYKCCDVSTPSMDGMIGCAPVLITISSAVSVSCTSPFSSNNSTSLLDLNAADDNNINVLDFTAAFKSNNSTSLLDLNAAVKSNTLILLSSTKL